MLRPIGRTQVRAEAAPAELPLFAAFAQHTIHHKCDDLRSTVDGGPKIITFVVDGVLCEGGEERQFGWGRFSPHLRAPNGAEQMRLAPGVSSLRIYRRALRTSEAVGNFRAGP